MNRKARPATKEREARRLTLDRFELRDNGDSGELTLEGHASVFDVEYEVAGGPPWGWIESVDTGAFDKTLKQGPDVALLVNHDGLPLARTTSGTLELSTDKTGLALAASLDANDPDVAALVPKIERGDVDEMSFAFRVERQEWDEEYERRWIKEANIHRGDVSVVTYGASSTTDVSLRAVLADADPAEIRAALAELDRDLLPAVTAGGETYTAVRTSIGNADNGGPETYTVNGGLLTITTDLTPIELFDHDGIELDPAGRLAEYLAAARALD